MAFLRAYYGQHGIMPSFSEIQAELGIKSKGQVAAVLTRLEARGLIYRDKFKARGIRFTGGHIKLHDAISAVLDRVPLSSMAAAELRTYLLGLKEGVNVVGEFKRDR